MLKLFFIALVALPAIDFLWIGVLMANFYKTEFGTLMRSQMLYGAAVVVYIFLALGIAIFVLPRAGEQIRSLLFYGFLFGFTVYGIYDMTNLATIQGWTLKLSLVDMCWGGVLCALVTLLCGRLKSVVL